jgi:hypothetical protein
MGQKYVSAFHRRDASKTVNLIDKVSFMDQDKNYPHDKKKKKFFLFKALNKLQKRSEGL